MKGWNLTFRKRIERTEKSDLQEMTCKSLTFIAQEKVNPSDSALLAFGFSQHDHDYRDSRNHQYGSDSP